jgi:hypothetical protein
MAWPELMNDHRHRSARDSDSDSRHDDDQSTAHRARRAAGATGVPTHENEPSSLLRFCPLVRSPADVWRIQLVVTTPRGGGFTDSAVCAFDRPLSW